jgi:predicted enzyme related to lactoylglutathione lyase
MARVDGKDVGAVYKGDGSQPVHWNNYIAVDSADDAAERARELGGTVAMEPFDVMGVGRMVLIQDPQGAFIALWESTGHIGAGYVNAPGALSWNELLTSDIDGARKFYGELLGYGWDSMDMGPRGTYWVPKVGDRSVAGMMQMPDDGPPVPAWMAYFGVEDADTAVDRARELGGQVLFGPITIPGDMGRIAVVTDPQGGTFAVYAGEFRD